MVVPEHAAIKAHRHGALLLLVLLLQQRRRCSDRGRVLQAGLGAAQARHVLLLLQLLQLVCLLQLLQLVRLLLLLVVRDAAGGATERSSRGQANGADAVHPTTQHHQLLLVLLHGARDAQGGRMLRSKLLQGRRSRAKVRAAPRRRRRGCLQLQLCSEAAAAGTQAASAPAI